MIKAVEIKRMADRLKVGVNHIDLDYSLAWFLLGLNFSGNLNSYLAFKGGTCLKKCYFREFQFSVDLDFTLVKNLSQDEINQWIQRASEWTTNNGGPDFLIKNSKLEIINDDYGNETYRIRAYCRGPIQWEGSSRLIKVDITRQEVLCLPRINKPIIHPYSDKKAFKNVYIPCYSLEEIMAEKIRAITLQRKHILSRDIYDIYRIQKTKYQIAVVKSILEKKFDTRSLHMKDVNIELLLGRETIFQKNWQDQVVNIIGDQSVTFEKAWKACIKTIQLVFDQSYKPSD